MNYQKNLLLSLGLMLISLYGLCQHELDWTTPLPQDPKVIIGTLENGMTYYIRQNKEPQERAEFYIVHNVGAVLEDDDQDGLAHFTEHMAFQGTKNFPGKGVLNYLENIGVRFGHNVNAFTGQDLTAYNLSNVPTIKDEVIDTALLILHDWSSYISFDPEEIELERGVIREEWRTYRTAQWRLQQAKMRYMFHGSIYAERDVIGDIDIINNFEHETLTKFYKEWYRPDLQAVIVVGDFDPEVMEAKIKARFSEIPARENPQPRPNFDIPDHKEPLVGVYTDPEATRTMVEVLYKHPREIDQPRTLEYFRNQITRSLHGVMLNNRFNEMVQEENPPFVYAYSYYGRLVRTKAVYALAANAREKESERALRSILQEGYRVYQHGFTQSELDRAKADLMRSYERTYRERDQRKNESFINSYISHFAENDAIPGIDFEYMLATQVIPIILLDEVNELTPQWITDENLVIFISGPEKETSTIPSKEKILSIYEEVKNSDLEPWLDETSDEPLIGEIPAPGKVVEVKQVEQFDATEWTLANGLKVILKPTDFKDDEILLSAYSPGGFSLVPDEKVPSAMLITAITNMSGVGQFSRVELDRMLAGKMVSVSPYVTEFEEGFNGSSSPDDLEIMLQLVHLYFTNPRFDEAAFNAYMARLQAVLQNNASSPNAIFNDSVNFIMNDRHVRKRPLNVDFLKEVNFEKLKAIYLDRILDASDFTFVLVGNFKPDDIQQLVETYLGSIPKVEREETWRDNNVRFPRGEKKLELQVPMQDPKSSCFVAYQSKAQYNRMNNLLINTIEYILDLRYIETIREDEGGTYGVAVRTSLSQRPKESVTASMYFDTDMEKAEYLVSIIHKEFMKLQEDGPSEVDLNKAKENFLKLRQEQLRENGFWSSILKIYYQNGIDLVANFDELVRGLTVEDIQRAAQEFFGEANMLEIIMSAE